MNDRLLIITRVKKTIEYVHKTLDNYPKKYMELKKHIIDALFDILEFSYLANNDFEKIKYQTYIIVKIYLVDYYLKLSYKNDLISKRKYEMLSKKLLEINKMVRAWMDYSEKQKESI